MAKVMVHFNFPGFTTKQYDQVWDDIRAAGHGNPKGLLHHFGAQNGNDIVVVDVWESADAFTKFGEALMPVMIKNGIPNTVVPMVLPIHYEYKA